MKHFLDKKKIPLTFGPEQKSILRYFLYHCLQTSNLLHEEKGHLDKILFTKTVRCRRCFEGLQDR